ncbi:MAG: helix-turn-helix transcriptional regulator, partial [Clostridia bacterium]|nr:helix-turn-helix transcriptional regulator [Clostridia bacterium]
MTSRTLADKVNVSYSTVNKILQGKDNIRVKTIKKLEKVLGVKLISDNIYEKLKIALQYSK